MKTIITAIILSVVLTAFVLAEENNSVFYKKASEEIIKACIENNINTVAMLPIENKNAIPKEELDFMFEKILFNLQSQNKVLVYENSLIDQLGRKNLARGLVLGKVFRTEKGLKIILKLIRSNDGMVIRSGQTDIEREPSILSEEKDRQEVSLPQKLDPKKEYRDAVKDFNSQHCPTRYKQIAQKQEDLVELKARYWANKFKDKDFSISKLKRNPGTEIKDSSIKEQFYSLLKEYSEQEATLLTENEKETLKDLFTDERAYINDCGM